jgi:hypothetical protein
MRENDGGDTEACEKHSPGSIPGVTFQDLNKRRYYKAINTDY